MNEEIEKASRSGVDSISNDIVAGQTQTLDVIDAYVKNNGGTCERSEAKPVEDE